MIHQTICNKLGFTKKSEVLYKEFRVEGRKMFEEHKIHLGQRNALSYYKLLGK